MSNSMLKYPPRRSLRHVFIRIVSLRSLLEFLILGLVAVSTYPTKTLDLLNRFQQPALESHQQESVPRASSLLAPHRSLDSAKLKRPQVLDSPTASHSEVYLTPDAQLSSSQGTKQAGEPSGDDTRTNEGISTQVQTELPMPSRSKSNGEFDSVGPFDEKKMTHQAPKPPLKLIPRRGTKVGNSDTQDAQLRAGSSKAVAIDFLPSTYNYKFIRLKPETYTSKLDGYTRSNDIHAVDDVFGAAELLNLGLQKNLETLLTELTDQWSRKALDAYVVRCKLIENMRSEVDFVTRAVLAKIRVISEAHEPAFFEDEDEMEKNQKEAFEVLVHFWKNLEVPRLERREKRQKTGQGSKSGVNFSGKGYTFGHGNSKRIIPKTEESQAANKLGIVSSKIAEKNALVWTTVAYWMRQKQPGLYGYLGGNADLDPSWKMFVADTALLKAGLGVSCSDIGEQPRLIYKLIRNFDIIKSFKPPSV